jgi:hypothetical protein
MSDGDRPTRWRKARTDWPGFQWRDLAVAGLGLALAVAVLAITGFSGKTMVEVAIVAGTGAVAATLYAMGQLAWAWLQAPMRLLTEDVIAIRNRLEVMPRSELVPLSPHIALLNFIRLGKEHLEHDQDAAMDAWTEDVLAFLNEHMEASEAETFLTVTEGTGSWAFRERIEYLETLANPNDEIPF